MAYPTRVADAFTGYNAHQQYPHAGQWEYGGAIFCFGMSVDVYGNGIILLKSVDRGLTWAQANPLVQIRITVGTYTFAWGTCTSINFATTPEVFLCCIDPTADLIPLLSVYRFNLAEEQATAHVAHVPVDVFSSIPRLYMDDCAVYIEQSTGGQLGVMSITKYLGPGEEGPGLDDYTLRRACLFQIDPNLTAFSIPPVVITPGDISKHSLPVGICRGVGGRVHGLIKVYGSGPDELYHTLVLDSSGTIGSGAIDFVAFTGVANYLTSDPAGGLLAFASGTDTFRSLTALSQDHPTWTVQDPFLPTMSEGFAFWDGPLWVSILTDGVKLYLSARESGQWATPVLLYTGTTINVLSGAFTPQGFGVFFTVSGPPVFPDPPTVFPDPPVFSLLDLWFFAISAAAVNCGQLSTDPVPEGCPVIPPSDSTGQCNNSDFQGYGY
jgi:hypothetical protein